MGKTYKAVEITKPGTFRLIEKPVVERGEEQVRIRVEACGVCHSDAGTVEGQLLPRRNGGAAGSAGTSLACPQTAARRHCSGGRRGHYAHGQTGTQEDYGRSEYTGVGETGEALFRSKQVESGNRRSLCSSARTEKAGRRGSGRPRRRTRSEYSLSRLGTIQWRAFRQARQDHAAVPGRQRRLRQYDSSPQFLHAERASPERHAVDLPRRWAWIVVPVSQVIRSTSFAVSRFRRHQLKTSVALVTDWR